MNSGQQYPESKFFAAMLRAHSSEAELRGEERASWPQEFFRGERSKIPIWGGEPNERDLRWYRGVVLAALVASIAITWRLWNVRVQPPLLPLVPLPEVSLGTAIITASVASLIRPKEGAIVLTFLIAFGMAIDQTRMQPEFFSFPILLWGSLPLRGPRLVARVHLITLWFYAGAHKLLSPDFLSSAGALVVRSFPFLSQMSAVYLAVIAVVFLEIGTAWLAIVPTTRWIAAWSALALHLGILSTFSPLGEARNPAIWPWNVALACSGFALIAPWKSRFAPSFAASGFAAKAVTTLLLIMPIGFYAGVVDAYPAHQLYSSAVANATVYCPFGCRPEQDINATWFALNVPLPPQPRLFTASFARTCAPGDALRIIDPHPLPWGDQRPRQIVNCPAGVLPAAHP